jgi:putative membrane protein
MEKMINVGYVINSIAYSVIGMLIFGVGFWVFDRLTPYSLWKEVVEEKNVAVAIIVSAVSLGVCLIIASAIHG